MLTFVDLIDVDGRSKADFPDSLVHSVMEAHGLSAFATSCDSLQSPTLFKPLVASQHGQSLTLTVRATRFNLDNDPNEVNNLWCDSDHQDKKRELLDVLREPVECFVRGTHSGERSGGCAPKTSLRPQPPGFIDRAHSALRHYRIESLPAMANPAEAKFSLSGVQPRGLIQEQFPELAPVALERLVECWDNTAWLANRTSGLLISHVGLVRRLLRKADISRKLRRSGQRAWRG